jgi:hypothetical protein
MYHVHHAGGVFGRMAHLAMLGAGILFVGPIALGLAGVALGVVVAVLSLFLPFIVIGGIAYGPYLLVRHLLGYPPRQRPTLQVRRIVPESRPVRPAVLEVLPVERPAPPRPERRVRGIVARVAAEVLCGALVGGALGAVALVGANNEWRAPALLDYSALGAVIGAVVGFVVGGPRPAPAEKTATVA